MDSDQHMAKAVGKLSTEDMLEMIRLQVNPSSASSPAAAADTQADEAMPDTAASDDESSGNEGLSLQERLRQVKKKKSQTRSPPSHSILQPNKAAPIAFS